MERADHDADDDARRRFLKAVTAVLTGFIGGLAAVPGLAFLAHPLRRPTVTGGEGPLPVGTARDIKAGLPLRVEVVGKRRDAWLSLERVKLGACWLVRETDGRLRAFSTVCPHLGCGIDWNDQARTFECPCHGSAFDAAGKVVTGPSPRAMDELEVVTSADETVNVRYRRFRLGTSKKDPVA